MSDQYVGEIRVFGCNFAPTQWAQCNGQLLSISQNTALFSLLGTNYGGNGTTTFGLPNLQGRFPMHWGNGAGLTPRVVGETGGEATVTLLQTQIPSHSHGVNCVPSEGTPGPGGALFGSGGRGKQPPYAAGPASVAMSPSAVSAVGGSQPHDNMPPFEVLNFCIALSGIFPPRG